jgi:signal transduction histidine kinase
MKKYITLLFALFLSINLSFAQQEADALEGNYRLNERFQVLKSKSQNYKEYKVIKETVLDGFWKIVRDSVASKEAALVARDQNIKQLNSTLAETQTNLKKKEESMAEIVHDSTHINVIGINFSKSVFITTVAVIVGGLVLLVVFITGRLKLIHSSMKERADAFTSLSNEFEEYKRKAMEKQTKLSRELQTERNRLSENRGI